MSAHEKFRQLLEGASEVVPGLELNRRLSEIRAQTMDEFGQVSVYEFVLKGADPMLDLSHRVLPRLLAYLDDFRFPFPGPMFLLVPVWHGAEAHIFRAPELFTSMARVEEKTLEELLAALRAPKVLELGPG